jgi:hypothetical protein
VLEVCKNHAALEGVDERVRWVAGGWLVVLVGWRDELARADTHVNGAHKQLHKQAMVIDDVGSG